MTGTLTPQEQVVLARLTQIVADVVDCRDLTLAASTTAADVDGWDSLSHIQIITAIERAFGVRFRTGEVAGLEDVGTLVRRIASRLPPARQTG